MRFRAQNRARLGERSERASGRQVDPAWAEPRLWVGQERKPAKTPRRNRGGRVDATVTLESSVFLPICFFIRHQEKIVGVSGHGFGFFLFSRGCRRVVLHVVKVVFRRP